MKICTIGGIEIKINLFLILFAVLWCVSGYIGTAAVIFLAVTLHELAHAAVATALGVKVYEVVLYPFGGAARMDPVFEYSPVKECLIAAAGPLASILCAMVCISLEKYYPDVLPDCQTFIDYSFLIAGFNLLPALPLDGGRMVRAIICTGSDRGRSGKIMAWMGIILAAGIIGYGAYTFIIGTLNANFPILGVFLLIAALSELKSTRYYLAKTMLHRSKSHDNAQYMRVKTIAVRYDMPVNHLLGKMMGEDYYVIRVLGENMTLLGTLDESTVEKGILKTGTDACVGSLLNFRTETIDLEPK